MRDINIAVLAQLQGELIIPFYLIELTVEGTVYRYTDCEVPFQWAGNNYACRGFKAQPVSYSASQIVSQVSIELDILDTPPIVADFIGGDPQGGLSILKLIVLNSNFQIIGEPFILFEGIIDTWSKDDEGLHITLASENTRWTQNTVSYHSASCRWKVFKGLECQYTGMATWCDRSYARCLALANTVNFGGFRWLPGIMNKEIWWGRQQK